MIPSPYFNPGPLLRRIDLSALDDHNPQQPVHTLLPRVSEDEHLLLVLADLLQDLVITDIIHCLELLDSLLVGHTNELLPERAWPEGAIEVVQVLSWVDPQECCHIAVVGKGCRKTNNADRVAGLLLLADGTTDNAFQHWAAIIMQEMDFIDTDKTDQVRIARVRGFASVCHHCQLAPVPKP
ncbi:hypothetical protein KC349_g74 [Hortaea werneckii]|nr:hypothetical protein KC349_g74 [Hortaea werneckii]